MVEYAQESVDDVLDDMLPLVHEHNAEITYGITATDPLDIDVDLYRRMYELGTLKVFTVRDEGRLVGYALFHVANSLQRKYLKQAHEGGLYLEPAFRKGLTAVKFMAYVDAALAEEDCNMVLYSSPVANPRFGELLYRLGYSKVDEVYARRL